VFERFFPSSSRDNSVTTGPHDRCFDVGAPLFMPTTLRLRTGLFDSESNRPGRRDDAEWATVPLEPGQSTRGHTQRNAARRGILNAIVGWVGLAIALSLSSYAFDFTREQGAGDSVVTSWVAGVVAALALGPCVLFVVSAHRDMRRWWAPALALTVPALLGLNVVVTRL